MSHEDTEVTVRDTFHDPCDSSKKTRLVWKEP